MTTEYSTPDYYLGLPGNPKLLARSSSKEWEPKDVSDIYRESGLKTIMPVGPHALKTKLEQGLRTAIRSVLMTMSPLKWITCDYIRIGYDRSQHENNPIVALITVEKDTVDKVEAQRVVNEIYKIMQQFGVPDVEVEVKEGERWTSSSDDEESFGQLCQPQSFPLAGSSFAVSRKHSEVTTGVGTLGGYVEVDGTVYALTNHYVLLGSTRKEPFPTAEEASAGRQIFVDQPAVKDLEHTIAVYKRPNTWQDKPQSLEEWLGDRKTFGKVYQTSGIRIRKGYPKRSHRLDWGLVLPENTTRFLENGSFYNELPSLNSPTFLHWIGSSLRAALKTSGLDALAPFTTHMKRGLKCGEMETRQSNAEDRGKKYVLYKYGRTTQYTWGILSAIHTDYHSASSNDITDEWPILSPKDSFNFFSRGGDPGSLVFDIHGNVSGMLWGGPKDTRITYVTPLETIFDDIKKICGAKEVKLVVRKEDENAEILDEPEVPTQSFPQGGSLSETPSLLNEDIEGLGNGL